LNVELVNQLLAAGAKPTIQNTSGWSPLGSTFSGARDANDRFNPANPQQKMERAIAITKALLARGADPNERMASENYPLVFFAPLELAPLLLEAGAKLDATNDAGDTMLHYAAAISREELIPFLIERGVPLEAKNKKGETALHRAVGFLAPKGETLKLLLDKGADVKAVDNDGRTPLHRAVMQGTPAPVEALLEKGSDIEAKDREGATPLHLAAKGGRDQLVTLLLRRGAAVDAVDAQGKTALDWATKESTRKILIEHGGEGEKK
jgi:ankyrin repeat protein